MDGLLRLVVPGHLVVRAVVDSESGDEGGGDGGGGESVGEGKGKGGGKGHRARAQVRDQPTAQRRVLVCKAEGQCEVTRAGGHAQLLRSDAYAEADAVAAVVQHGEHLARVQLAHELLRLPLARLGLKAAVGRGEPAESGCVRLALSWLHLAHYRGVVIVRGVIDDLAVATDVHLVGVEIGVGG